MIIQCTKDLLKNMRREPEPIPDGEPINPLYTWNANIFRMGRNRMMILQNSMTRCVVILFRPKAADFAALDDRLGEAIRLLFAEMKIPESKTEEYLEKAGKCVITKSGSRKEIGRLVQVIKDLEYCLNVEEYFRMDTLYPTHISMWCCNGILWMTEDQRVLSATDSMREVFGLGKYEGSWSL